MSPTKRVTTNDIKFLKCLNECGNTLIDTKQKAQQDASLKILFTVVQKRIEQFQRDTTSLDLINDRSF